MYGIYGIYMVTWIPSIYPLYVSIYTSTSRIRHGNYHSIAAWRKVAHAALQRDATGLAREHVHVELENVEITGKNMDGV